MSICHTSCAEIQIAKNSTILDEEERQHASAVPPSFFWNNILQANVKSSI